MPFILVTGTISEEFAVNILKEGADDYLFKDKLARLPKAINDALERLRINNERQKNMENIIKKNDLLKEAEQMAGFGSWQADMATGFTRWSDEALRIYGYEPGEIVPDYETFLSHVHPDDRKSVKNDIQDVMKKMNSMEMDFRIVDKAGKLKYIHSKIKADKNKEGLLTRLVGFNQDITKRKDTEAKLINSYKEVAELEKELINQKLQQQKIITEVIIQTQEKEKNELGSELHDNINQILATVKMYIGMARSGQEFPEDLLGMSYEYVKDAMEELRKLSHSLVPPSLNDIGLPQALQDLIDEVSLGSGFEVQLLIDKNYTEKDKTQELMLYRIVQEQLNNITKYSKANKTVITLKTDNGNLFLSVKDNGVGFDTKQVNKGIGLRNISNRVDFYAGSMNIISAPGMGCTLEVLMPC